MYACFLEQWGVRACQSRLAPWLACLQEVEANHAEGVGVWKACAAEMPQVPWATTTRINQPFASSHPC